jgi:hypothetical protein
VPRKPGIQQPDPLPKTEPPSSARAKRPSLSLVCGTTGGTRADARVRVKVTPGDRFAYMVETVFGLARLGHVNSKGMPDPLQLACSRRSSAT